MQPDPVSAGKTRKLQKPYDTEMNRDTCDTPAIQAHLQYIPSYVSAMAICVRIVGIEILTTMNKEKPSNYD